MDTTVTREMLAAKFAVMLPHLDERQRRLVLGAEARALGRGGIRVVARAAGVREGTVAAGVRELEAGEEPLGRVRRPGGGRKRAAEADPGLVPALLALVGPDERGDPESPLRWTVKSTRKLAAELTARGHKVGADTVGDLLREAGFSLQGNAKTIEGQRHPDRDAQFRYINEQVKAHQGMADPVVSVDTKKKELVGQFRNAGREWRPRGEPAATRTHDFPGGSAGKAVPYGVYDLTADTGWVSVGTDHDTAAFAVESIRRWWKAAGSIDYPGARRLLITADAGGSNGYRTRAWKAELAALAVETGLEITCCHFPPGTSKWNKVEHRLFSGYHDELAGPAADQPRGHRADHRRHHHPHRAARACRTGHRRLPHRGQDQRRPDARLTPGLPRLARRLELHPPPHGLRPGRRRPPPVQPAQPPPGLAGPPGADRPSRPGMGCPDRHADDTA